MQSTVGTIIAKTAAETLTPVTLELGGRNPAIITKNADPRLAARRLLWAKLLNVGQVCVSQNYILVEKDVLHRATINKLETENDSMKRLLNALGVSSALHSTNMDDGIEIQNPSFTTVSSSWWDFTMRLLTVRFLPQIMPSLATFFPATDPPDILSPLMDNINYPGFSATEILSVPTEFNSLDNL